MSKKSDTHRYEIESAHVNVRIDKALSDLNEDLSRARIQALIAEGQVALNGVIAAKPSEKLAEGDVVSITIPDLKPAKPQAEDIPLDIVFEDDDLVVINKPAGLVVHPGAGNYDGTLVNALLHHCQGSLSGIGGVERPGIVHRLDKETSGLIVAAKHDKAHKGLAAQLEDRSLSRIYKALVLGVPMPPKGKIDQPLARHPGNRQKMAVQKEGGKAAVTHYHVQERYNEAFSLVECALESGRTHQIRVHMAFIKHPLIGDPAYGPQPTAVRSVAKKAGYDDDIAEQLVGFPRQALHAEKMAFIHPVSGKNMQFTAALPQDFADMLKAAQS